MGWLAITVGSKRGVRVVLEMVERGRARVRVKGRRMMGRKYMVAGTSSFVCALNFIFRFCYEGIFCCCNILWGL